MRPKLSFIFPVYKDGNVVENIIKIIKDPYPDELKEFIISVDMPTKEFLEKIKKIAELKNIKIIVSSERRGKVSSTNEAVKYATGDILIFFDSDVIIKEINLENLVKKFEEYDLIEFYKEIEPKGIIGKLTHIEFFLYYDIYLKISSYFKKSLFLNGGGFAVKRSVWEKLGGYKRVILEDVDFATRCYYAGYKYYMTKDIYLVIKPMNNFKSLFEQRKRWFSGSMEWLFEDINIIINFLIKNFHIGILYLLILNPLYLFFILFLLIPTTIFYEYSKVIYNNFVENLSFLYIYILSPNALYNILYSLFFLLAYVLLSAILYYVLYLNIKKKLNNFLYFLLFSMVYLPFLTIIFLYSFIYYIIFEKPPKLNWKV